MKKLILLVNLFAIIVSASAQNDTTRYTMVNGYGFSYNRLKAKAAIVMPTDTVQNKLPGSLVVLNDTLYVRTPVKWQPITAGAQGIPAGGTTGQLLAKDSDTSYDVTWIDNFTTDVREYVKATVAINKGQAVYVSGADGTNVLVAKASNISDPTSSKTIGLLYQNLSQNGQGYVITQGRLSGLNTIGATAGDAVWLGTNGNLLYGTANKPVAPAHLVYLGVVTRVNANNGEIFVHVQNGFELEELHDVLITDSLNNQVIAYDSTARLWKNRTIASVLGYTPVKTTDTASMLGPYVRAAGYGLIKSGQSLLADTAAIATRARVQKGIDSVATLANTKVGGSGTLNYVPKWTATSTLGNSLLFDNGTYVGLGTASPSARFDMRGPSTDVGIRYIETTTGNTNRIQLGAESGVGYIEATAGVGSPVMSMRVAGSERMRIDASGNVGIGTASPSYRLDVTGSNPRIRVQPTTGTEYALYHAQNSGGSGFIGLENSTGSALSTGAPYSLNVYHLQAYPILFSTSAVERMRIFANGRIGVNTNTDAGYQFDVNGTLRTVNGAVFATSSGDVGIGLSAAGQSGFKTLEVGGSGVSGLIDLYQGTSRQLRIYNSGNDAYIANITNNGSMIFRTTTSGGTQNNNLTITPAGNVGIGLTNPSAKLHLSTVFADSPLEEAFRIQRSGLSSYNGERAIGMVFADDANFTLTSAVTGIRQNPSGHYLGGLSFRVSTSVSNAVTTIGGLTEVGRFTSDGRLGIGTVTPSELLDVNGRARVRTIDSTASAMNVLYADATGVIKKASATAFPGGSGTTNYVPLWTGSNTIGNSAIFQSGTNIGLGRTNPSYKFDLLTSTDGFDGYNVNNNNAGANAISGYRAINGNGIGLIMGVTEFSATSAMGGANQSVIYGVGSQNLIFGTNSTERMRIANNGNVVIGQGTTGFKLFVDGDTYSRTAYGQTWLRSDASGGDSMSAVNIRSNATRGSVVTFTEEGIADRWAIGTRGGNSSLYFSTGANTQNSRMTITNGGNVLVGTTSDAGYRLDVNGTLRSVNGANFATTSGNVGIGTTSPQDFIHMMPISSPSYMRYGFSTSFPDIYGRIGHNGNSGGFEILSQYSGANVNSGNIRFINGLSGSTSEKMRITYDGNVGIGTASPSSKLHVIGTGASTNSINVGLIVDMEATAAEQVGAGTAILFRGKSGGGNIANYDQAQIATNNTGSNNSHGLSFFYKPNASSPLTEAMTIYGNGNVGFGTITPSYPIDAVGTASLAANNIASGSSTRFRNIYTRSRANSAGISGDVYADQLFHVSGGSAFEIYNADANFPLVFGTGATERMRIDGSGNVGIGTTSPAVKLDVNGNVRGTRINSTGGVVDFDAQSGSNFIQVSGGAMSFANAGAINMRIASSGNVGMGNNSPSFNLHVQKDQTSATSITVSNAGTASSSTIMQFLLSESGGTNGYLRRYRDGSGLVELGFTEALAFKGAVSGTPIERMRIDNAGNVGIGTNAPTAKFDVSNFNATNDASWIPARYVAGADPTLGGLYYMTVMRPSATASNRRIEIYSGDNVGYRNITFPFAYTGLGTTTPGARLDVWGDQTLTANFNFSGNGTYVRWQNNGTAFGDIGSGATLVSGGNVNDFAIHARSGNNIVFSTNFGEKMRVFANGNVGINTQTDAGYKFDVNGNTRVTGKIDVTANTSIGQSIIRSGTVDVAAQVFNSNGWFLYGAEGANGGAIFTGSTSYAAVAGSGYNRPLQLATNNTVRMEIDSTGLVGINTTSPTERLDVNGKARIRTVDSTATGMNMLYVDATGVVKKTAVPGSAVSYTTDVNTIASGWTFVKDSTLNTNHNFINVVQSTTTNEATATMQIAVYRTTSSFTTGSWQTVANVPSAYVPKTTVYFELPGYVGTETYYTSSNVRFTGAAEYTGVKVARVDPGGNVQVRIGTVSASAVTGGTNHVIFPLTLTWVVYNIPQ